MTFYDSHGKAIAYLHDDGIHIYLFNGRPVAYLYGDAVYGFNGHQFGWFEDGWIRDLNGCCVFFTENATGSGPVNRAKYAKPANCAKYAKQAKAAKSLSWSRLSGNQFFEQ